MKSSLPIKLLFLAIAFSWIALFPGCSSQQSFSSSDDAVTSLVSALRNDDEVRIHKILGPDADDLLSSGDSVADQNRVQKFLSMYDQKHSYLLTDDGKVVLAVGSSDWPMPIPVAKNSFNNQWYFDVKTGKEEMLNRRIGQNELDTIQTCLAIVDAQRDYAAMDPEHLGGGKPIYAQKFLSEAGQKNGLYWETKEGEKSSPLGSLFVSASAEGYTYTAGQPAPYHGYYYHILKSQSANAPGGAMDYIANGKMTGGFALIARPAEYGNSGVMTFIVSDRGILFSRDLGRDTEKRAEAITSFDPGPEWSPVPDANAIKVGQ